MSLKFNLQTMSFKKLDIEFENVTLVAGKRGGKKEIVKNVSGKFLSGQLTAIMGPSGAGKTSLLNILTGFQTHNVSGSIKCSGNIGKKNGPSEYKKDSCYILQDDILPDLFTVEECMMMAVNLKIANLSEKSKDYLINDVLEILGLKNCKKTRCESLSGGQRKRLSIALELVDNPPIMFLDEPTTGLDSAASAQCVRMLKYLASQGRTIICTIHQPSAIIYEMFDLIYMMSHGKCVYQGASHNTVPFLSSAGFCCPQYHNPADYFLEVVNGDYGNFTDYLVKAATRNNWRNTVPTIQITTDHIQDVQKDSIYDSKSCSFEVPTEWSKLCVLLKRTGTQIYRDWTISQLKLLLHVFTGIIVGLTFQNAGTDASKITKNLGFLIVGMIYIAYTACMPGVLKFPTELRILKKERFNNWYKLKTYYIAFMLFDIPLQLTFSTAYSLLAFSISSQPFEFFRISRALAIQGLVGLSSSSLGHIMGSLWSNPVNGLFWGSIIIAIMILFAGFLIIFSHMNILMYFMTYFCFTSFAIEGLMQSVYGYNRPNLVCPEEVEYCPYTSPASLLKDIGMDKQNFWLDMGYLVATFLVFRTIAFCTLKRKISTA